MAAKIISGNEAAEISGVEGKSRRIKREGYCPGLGVVLVGEDPARYPM